MQRCSSLPPFYSLRSLCIFWLCRYDIRWRWGTLQNPALIPSVPTGFTTPQNKCTQAYFRADLQDQLPAPWICLGSLGCFNIAMTLTSPRRDCGTQRSLGSFQTAAFPQPGSGRSCVQSTTLQSKQSEGRLGLPEMKGEAFKKAWFWPTLLIEMTLFI